MVILPLLRQKLVEEGGFATLGSVFTWHGRVFFIHGIPGSGKSRTALQALELGAEFVGDNEIFVWRDGSITAVFDEFEVRRATIRGTNLWLKLSTKRRLLLHVYTLISALTLGSVSFNISMLPSELGATAVPAKIREGTAFVVLCHVPVIRTEKSGHIVQDLLKYERWFYETYGLFLLKNSKNYFSNFTANAQRLLDLSSCWRIPIGTCLDDILELGQGLG
jgi:hypothetical protein